jgi:hypothetical protein
MTSKCILGLGAALVSLGLMAGSTTARAQRLGPEAVFGAAAVMIGAAALANAHRDTVEAPYAGRRRAPRAHRGHTRPRATVARQTQQGGQARDPFASASGRSAPSRDPFTVQTSR